MERVLNLFKEILESKADRIFSIAIYRFNRQRKR